MLRGRRWRLELPWHLRRCSFAFRGRWRRVIMPDRVQVAGVELELGGYVSGWLSSIDGTIKYLPAGMDAWERSQTDGLKLDAGGCRLPNSRYDDADDGVHHGRPWPKPLKPHILSTGEAATTVIIHVSRKVAWESNMLMALNRVEARGRRLSSSMSLSIDYYADGCRRYVG